MASSILLVDRDLIWAESVANSVRPYLLKVFLADNVIEAMNVLARMTIELVVLDEGVLSITEFLCGVKARRRPALVVTTDRREYSMALEALRARAADVLHRPIDSDELAARIAVVLEDRVASPHYLSRKLDGFLRDNCKMPELCLAYLSRHFGISKSYASLLLRRDHWGGFSSRLAHHRVSKACGLMTNSDSPMYLISEECGFSSPSRMSEAFSRIMGMTPKRYRAHGRNNL